MLSHLAAHAIEIKLALAAFVGFGAWLADASDELNAKGWEEAGLKGLLILAVICIGKLFLEAQKVHRAEMEKVWDAHKADVQKQKEAAEAREEKLRISVENNTSSLKDLTALTKEQTDYFKAVTRNIVNEKLNGGKPTMP